ncbi:MAG: hypothetical protein CM15mP79_2570 [Methanobacteriota archaeon]|nr:MAG: hypothetical protein CM15mP79_2570 [Euryarchaeota archaeon]
MSGFDLRAIAHELRPSWALGQENLLPHYEQVVLRFQPERRGRLFTSSSSEAGAFHVLPETPRCRCPHRRSRCSCGNNWATRASSPRTARFYRLLRMSFTTKGGRSPSHYRMLRGGKRHPARRERHHHPALDPRNVPRQDAGGGAYLPPPARIPMPPRRGRTLPPPEVGPGPPASTWGGTGQPRRAFGQRRVRCRRPRRRHGSNRSGRCYGSCGLRGCWTRWNKNGRAPGPQGGRTGRSQRRKPRCFLMEHVEEATPVLLPDHAKRTSLPFPGMLEAIDAWWGDTTRTRSCAGSRAGQRGRSRARALHGRGTS